MEEGKLERSAGALPQAKKEHRENMNNDSFPTGNQASAYAKHLLYHWATALALENDFNLEWGLRKRQSQGPRNRPRQREMIKVQIKPSCGTWQLQKAVQRKSHLAQWQAPGAGLREVSVMTQLSRVESQQRGCQGQGEVGEEMMCVVA